MENNVIQRLEALATLQKIDSKLDLIRNIRGGLPEEVSDLEDGILQSETRLDKIQSEISEKKAGIANYNIDIQVASDNIVRYTNQLNDIRSNKELEILTNEKQLKELDIEGYRQKITKLTSEVRLLEEREAEVMQQLEFKKRELDIKVGELDSLVAETKIEEDALLIESKNAEQFVEPRLLKAYHRIRKSMRNGLGVVSMDRGACGGCFAVIPPQRVCEIRSRKKMIICENCGRILVDETYFDPTAVSPEAIYAQ